MALNLILFLGVFIPLGVTCLCVVCVIILIKALTINRQKPPGTLVPVMYMPQKVQIPLDVIVFSSPLSRRQRRKLRVRKMPVISKKFASSGNNETEGSEETGEENELPDDLRRSKSSPTLASSLFTGSSFFNSLRGSFFTTSVSSPDNSSKYNCPEGGDIEQGVNSSKNKRFVSQDRLKRAESRKMLIKSSTVDLTDKISIIVEDEIDSTLGPLDVAKDIETKRQIILQRRRQERDEAKQEARNNGVIDIIALNAGPTAEFIPAGYRVITFFHDMRPENVLYRRILYKWEYVNEVRPQGWFVCTVVGTSKQSGCNYAIKYDRKETGNLFVDGFHSVMLSAAGESAYGRRWVALERVDKEGNIIEEESIMTDDLPIHA